MHTKLNHLMRWNWFDSHSTNQFRCRRSESGYAPHLHIWMHIYVHCFSSVDRPIEVHHSEWFSWVEQVRADVGIEPSLPQVCGRHCHRSNAPAQTPSEYYRTNLSIPVFDQFLSELDSCFTTHQQTALKGLYLIPSVLVSKSVDDISPKTCQLGQMYECDLVPTMKLTQ